MFFRIVLTSSMFLAVGFAQPAERRAKPEFDVASIKVNPPKTGFHFAQSTGTPDWSSPGMFRCADCTLATLISAAFELKGYQFPGKSSLGNDTFEVAAKYPSGTNREDLPVMLQNLLKDRFGLTYHFKEKSMKGYQLVVAKNGPKLKESPDGARPAAEAPNRPWNGNGDGHGGGQSAGHKHDGLVNMFGSASYRANGKTMAELAQIVSEQLGVPVDDQTKLAGKYDIALTWTSSNTQSSTNHSDDSAGHGDHGGSGAAGSGARRDESGPTLFEALQSQLGLKLVAS
jgi:uncharacterized protein (TIGR03435 family)